MELLENSSVTVRQVKTSKEIAKYFQVRQDTVKMWKKKGMPVEPNGLYDLNRISAWRIAHYREKGEHYIYPTANVGEFKAKRADIYAREQAEAIKIQQTIRHYHFSKEKIQSLEKRDAISLYDQLRRDQKDKYEQERLERGESTGNIAVMVSRIKELKSKRRSKGEDGEGKESAAG